MFAEVCLLLVFVAETLQFMGITHRVPVVYERVFLWCTVTEKDLAPILSKSAPTPLTFESVAHQEQRQQQLPDKFKSLNTSGFGLKE